MSRELGGFPIDPDKKVARKTPALPKPRSDNFARRHPRLCQLGLIVILIGAFVAGTAVLFSNHGGSSKTLPTAAHAEREERIEEELAKVEDVIKQRQAERIADALESSP